MLMPEGPVKVVSTKTVLTLQAAEYFELERFFQDLTIAGWQAEERPRFQPGQKVWQVSLSRPEQLSRS